jgi:nicotinate (nicotinamide) nucleotide adenylyltransferase/putative HD superfamily hydrolase of NAD metabolism
MDSESVGRRIGIMGGTFDPIHFGHLMLAEQIRTSLHLDEVLFIPVGKAPHKSLANAADKMQRFEMTQLAIESNPFFKISDIEIRQKGTTYAIDTVKAIKKTLQDKDELFFITGADAILQLESWKEYAELIQLVNFIGATRPGVDPHELSDQIERLKFQYGAKIELSYVPALAISSTDIRKSVEEEKSVKYLLPESVEAYIQDNFLYRQHHPMLYKMKEILQTKLSAKRFKHCVETAHLSRKLAVLYGAQAEKAEFAGLCHDYAKEIKSKEMLQLVKRYDIFEDDSILATPNLAHGEVAAALLKSEYHILDQEILDAIRWHTYGIKNMSLLCKIVYVADIIEPSRHFNGVEILRKLAYISLDETILTFHGQCEQLLSSKKLKLHKNTQEMIDQLKKDKNNRIEANNGSDI